MDNLQQQNAPIDRMGAAAGCEPLDHEPKIQTIRVGGSSPPLVLYHGGGCTDGYGAAFAAWCKFGDDAEYVPMQYGDALPPVDGRDVYVLDFSFPRQETQLLCTDAKSFTWLDHHKTAFEMWAVAEGHKYREEGPSWTIILDNNKSGALLAWEHFHPGKDVPYLISRIDDRDRWQFKLVDSKELHAGLQLEKPWTFERWAELVPAMGGSTHALVGVIASGRAALAVYREQIQASAYKAHTVAIPHPQPDFTLQGERVEREAPWVWHDFAEDARHRVGRWQIEGLVVNTPQHISEVGHELAKASGTFGLVWWFDAKTHQAVCSLRSNGDYDVSAVAKAYGGGGHKNAAGFKVDMLTLLGWLK